jgi:outer membrane protein assembly factor BamB
MDSAAMADNEQELLDLVAPYNVVLWLQGHGHTDVEWNVNGVPATMLKGLYQGSYDIINVTADEMRITKRHVPPNKVKELLESSSQPSAELPAGRMRPLMTIPLKKRTPPKWDAKVALDGRTLSVHVARGDLPADATFELRIDTAKPVELAEHVEMNDQAPGIHAVTIRAVCTDGRVYQKASTVTLPGKVTPAWVTDIGGAVQSRLVRDGDRVYVTSMGNDLVALNAADGKEAFRFKTGGPIFSSPDVVDGVVYFGSEDHFVYAVDAKNGGMKWKKQTRGAVLAGPAVANGVVCIGSCDTNIYGLSASDGRELWHVKGDNMFQSKAATDGERFFVGGWDNHFRCIDARSGKVVWDLALGRKQAIKIFSAFAPAITHPCVGGGKVFVSTNDGIFHAIDIATGEEAWRVDRKNMGYSSPCYHDGKVYFALSDKGDTYCADANTGNILWQRDVGSVIYDGGFCFGGGNVFVGCVSGVFNAIDASSGQIVWKYSLGPGHLLGTGAADDKHVYIGSMNGKIFALPTEAR